MLKKVLLLSIAIFLIFLVPKVFGGSGDTWKSCCSSGCDYSPGQEVIVGGSTYCCKSTGWASGSCPCSCTCAQYYSGPSNCGSGCSFTNPLTPSPGQVVVCKPDGTCTVTTCNDGGSCVNGHWTTCGNPCAPATTTTTTTTTTTLPTTTTTTTTTTTLPSCSGDISVTNQYSTVNPSQSNTFTITASNTGSNALIVDIYDEIWEDRNCNGVEDRFECSAVGLPSPCGWGVTDAGSYSWSDITISPGSSVTKTWSTNDWTANYCYLHTIYFCSKPLDSSNPCWKGNNYCWQDAYNGNIKIKYAQAQFKAIAPTTTTTTSTTTTTTTTTLPSCTPGSVCSYSCNGACKRDVYKYDSNCNCVYSYTENAPLGQHCDSSNPGTWTSSGYCGSGSVYCYADRYRKIDRYECNGAGNCNYYDYTDTLQDCGATSYSCLSSCVKRYTYTCSAGSCGTYTADYNCPQDTSCSAGTCSSNTACLTGSYECKDSCTKGQKQYRCDGSGNCNRFWQWVNLASCNPFSCSAGSCSNTCSAACGADSACDGKTPGSSCGTGKECNSNCQCVVVACSGYTSSSSCNADPNCAWCSGDNTCKAKSAVVCQPPSCSADSKSRCTSSCTWQDCGSTDSSCYCSAGSCIACSGSTPYCNNYACVQCLSNTQGQKDCPKCYQRCDLSTYTCYDFRPSLTGTCAYYDYCTSSTCASNPEYCYNAEPSLCQDSNWKCHAWFSC